MNKKGQFVAILSLFVVLGLLAVYFILDKSTGEVVRMYYKPTDVLNQNFEIKEYLFNLKQEIKYDTFKAFEYFSENSGFEAGGRCEAWYESLGSSGSSITGLAAFTLIEDGKCNPTEKLEENFESYFNKPNYIVNIVLMGHKFKIKYVYDGIKIFEESGVKTELQPEVEYVLDYDVSVFSEMYENCRDVVSCDELDDCKVTKCDDSSDINYIKMEFDFTSNDFIEPKLRFNIPKTEEL